MIETWSRGVANANMDEEILVDLTPLIRRHPWWQARARLTLALLDHLRIQPPARVLDAGCGWGVTLEALERKGFSATGSDISLRALEQLHKPGRNLIEADLTQPISQNIELYDAVLALDVIEHLDDDRGAVENLAMMVKPGGIVIVSVPALPDLFSEFDAIQGHRRRYLPQTLSQAFEDTGLEVMSMFWWCQWLVPRLRKQRERPRGRLGESSASTYGRYLKIPPWPTSWLLRMAFAMEQDRALEGRLTTGTSLFAVARRNPIGQRNP